MTDWMTAPQVQREHEIAACTIYAWAPLLQDRDLARRTNGEHGFWLLSPRAVSFLKTRRDKRGRSWETRAHILDSALADQIDDK